MMQCVIKNDRVESLTNPNELTMLRDQLQCQSIFVALEFVEGRLTDVDDRDRCPQLQKQLDESNIACTEYQDFVSDMIPCSLHKQSDVIRNM